METRDDSFGSGGVSADSGNILTLDEGVRHDQAPSGNYSPRTIETYTRCVAGFAKHFSRSPAELGREHIREYQIFLVETKQTSYNPYCWADNNGRVTLVTESSQDRHTGDVGEHRVALLLNELGFSVATPSPDPGVDLLAMSWNSEKKYGDVTFFFQVKERRSPTTAGVRIRPGLAEAALGTPVLIVKTSGTEFENCFAVCVLHRWLLRNTDKVGWGKSLWIPDSDFETVTDLRGMRELLLREAKRVSVGEGSPWRTSVRMPSVVAESEILFEAGSLHAREPTEAVIRRVQEIVRPGTSEGLFQALAELRGQPGHTTPKHVREDPVISRWIDSISNPRSAELGAAESQIIRQFAEAVEQYLRGEHFSMPKYTWEQVNTWRILLGVYPATLDLVEHVLNHRNLWTAGPIETKWSLDEVKASLGLLGAAACSDDEVMGDRARAQLDRMVRQHGYPASAKDENVYGFHHAFYWALAQANEKQAWRAQNFLSRSMDRPTWQLRLNRHYYGVPDDSTLRRVSLSRSENPRRRDLNLMALSEIQLDLVRRFGIVTAETEVKHPSAAQQGDAAGRPLRSRR